MIPRPYRMKDAAEQLTPTASPPHRQRCPSPAPPACIASARPCGRRSRHAATWTGSRYSAEWLRPGYRARVTLICSAAQRLSEGCFLGVDGRSSADLARDPVGDVHRGRRRWPRLDGDPDHPHLRRCPHRRHPPARSKASTASISARKAFINRNEFDHWGQLPDPWDNPAGSHERRRIERSWEGDAPGDSPHGVGVGLLRGSGRPSRNGARSY